MVIAIDPGNVFTGWAILEGYRPVKFDKSRNEDLLEIIKTEKIDEAVIEMVASYGMPAGSTLFETCVWIGRFTQALAEKGVPVSYAFRKRYVTDLCGSPRAKDANVIQYLIDRFAKDVPNRGKGSKKEPGIFYGFKADIWQAYAIGVWYMDGKVEAYRGV